MARGTKLVVSTRSEPGLDSLVDEIRQIGGGAIAMPADVADFEQVKAIADRAIQQYGRLDTWVHLAAINLYAIFEQTFGGVLQSPNLGYAGEFNNKLLKSFDAWNLRPILGFSRAGLSHGDRQSSPTLSSSGCDRPCIFDSLRCVPLLLQRD